MKRKFNPAEYVRRIGCDLVRAFHDARQATTPALVGDAMEQPVRSRLEQILPRGIGVGSGCVVDSEGGTSRQMDVVLYERGLCPVFCVNDSPETTYYPCEGVLAVGEVKSTIGKRELADAFKKIRSVKILNRAYEAANGGPCVGRRYGDQGSSSSHGFHRDHTNKGDVLGFILAEKASLPVTLPDPSATDESAPRATLLEHYVDNVQDTENDVLCPDFLVLLEGTLLTPQTCTGSRPYTPVRFKNVLPHLIHPVYAESPFGELVKLIWKRHQDGLTAHIPLAHYLHYEAKTEPRLKWAAIANVDLDEVKLRIGDPVEIATPTDHLRDELAPLYRKRI
ncbi:MAG: hypothetical protein F4X15_16055 [Gemmatimonadetes bacterium]|nr:hypothetical protein [Gemmatimonadota bacterium]